MIDIKSKIQDMFAGLISWNLDDEKMITQKEESALDKIANTLSTNNLLNVALGTNIGRIFADVKISEAHRFSTTITDQTLEDGSSIHEHAIPQQPQVTLQIYETNSSLFSNLTGGFSGPQQVFDKLTMLWENAIPLTITTQHKQYKNMIIANMPIVHNAPYKNSLQISIDLKKLEFTKIETVSYKAKTKGITKAASESIAGGRQNAIDLGIGTDIDFSEIDSKIAALGG